ncbi:hypothetical protein [Sphingomonas oleivorans]|uniref:hypothetical protein n=1 Tax=Sphingomonas oleivorans TaxID=1735121 RepID=UPI0013FD612E|nr:hypothetical protein [Sphingomonas oleivorans]
MIVTLTPAGRALREKGAQRTLVAATGLDRDEFTTTQRAMVKVRDNLLKHVKAEEGAA